MSYDLLGRINGKTDPAGKATSFAYDAAGNRVTMIDALGRQTKEGESMIYWVVVFASCIALTILGAVIGKRPLLAAIVVSGLAGAVVGVHGWRTAPLWLIGSIVVTACSLPVTIITAIVTDNVRNEEASIHYRGIVHHLQRTWGTVIQTRGQLGNPSISA